MPKARTLSIALLASLAVISLGFAAQPDRSKRNSSPIIHKKMERIADALGSLVTAIEADETKDALKQLEIMQENVIDAKSQTPAIVKELEREDRDAETVEFRKHLVELLKTLCDVELHILDGDTSAAMIMLNDTLESQEHAGHERFIPERD